MISYLRSSTHRLPYHPKLPSRYRLPHPPLLLLRPYLWPHSLTCASLPPLYPPPQTTSPTAIRMRYAHQLFHRLQSLLSLQHTQHLPSLGYPNIYLLLVELVKHFCWMLSSSLQGSCHTYLALGGVRIRLTRNSIYKNGWARLRGMWRICGFARGSHALFPGCLSLAHEGEACLAPHSLGQDLAG